MDWDDERRYDYSWEIKDNKLSIGSQNGIKIEDIASVEKGSHPLDVLYEFFLGIVWLSAVIIFFNNKIDTTTGFILGWGLVGSVLYVLGKIQFFESINIIDKSGYIYKYNAFLPEGRKRLNSLRNTLDDILNKRSIVGSMGR